MEGREESWSMQRLVCRQEQKETIDVAVLLMGIWKSD